MSSVIYANRIHSSNSTSDPDVLYPEENALVGDGSVDRVCRILDGQTYLGGMK